MYNAWFSPCSDEENSFELRTASRERIVSFLPACLSLYNNLLIIYYQKTLDLARGILTVIPLRRCEDNSILKTLRQLLTPNSKPLPILNLPISQLADHPIRLYIAGTCFAERISTNRLKVEFRSRRRCGQTFR